MKAITIGLLFALFSVEAQDATDMSLEEQYNTTNFVLQSNCLADEGLSMDDVIEFFESDRLELAEAKPKLKCFSACYMEYNEILSGCQIIFDEEHPGFHSRIGGMELSKLVEACKWASQAGDRCECGYQMLKCFSEQTGSTEGKK